MKKWLAEDWEFTLTALEGEARHCRLGIEQGDRFVFQYGTPADFCPRAMMEIYTWCEVIRCGGDFSAERLRVQNRNGALVPLPLHSFPLVGRAD